MSVNNLTYLKYILFNTNFVNIKNNAGQLNQIQILTKNTNLNFLAIHFKLSTFFYMNQLVDMFSYEVLTPVSNKNNSLVNTSMSNIVVYNFHSISSQVRSFIFIQDSNSLSNFNNQYNSPDSISDYFISAGWLEREISELHNVNFNGRKDLRNLMLQYGDSSSPFKKSFPSIGLKESYYNAISDCIVQKDISINL